MFGRVTMLYFSSNLSLKIVNLLEADLPMWTKIEHIEIEKLRTLKRP